MAEAEVDTILTRIRGGGPRFRYCRRPIASLKRRWAALGDVVLYFAGGGAEVCEDRIPFG